MPTDSPPTATYRLQLQPGFGFAAAADTVPYLASLGVSHVYLSPVLQATPGSRHGYDVVDHNRFSEEHGGWDGWRGLVDTAHAHGLGIVVDIVPNHMAIPTPEWDNIPLWDVLRHGRDADHATWFDIDWDAGDGRVLLPFLGDLGDRPVFDASGGPGGEPVLRYHEHAFPVAPGTEHLTGEKLLDAQHYRLAYWREASERLNYRRFFDVTTLIAIRVEDPDVFDATHRLLLDAVGAGDIDGLRVDHPDGLADPAGYLARLAKASGNAWIVVEKILGREERLASWPVDGTTGYDALSAVNEVFCDDTAAEAMTRVYRTATGVDVTFPDLARSTKLAVARGPLRAETLRIARAGGHPEAEDSLAEWLASWPVYRTYVPPGGPPSQDDASTVVVALLDAAGTRPDGADAYPDWAARLLTGAGEFATRLQQTTGMVMAKGVEDTAFYRYHRLAALCEVGGDPARFGSGPAGFHADAAHLASEWPHTMTTLSTHDTKRAEDVRARLLVLAELPDEWAAAVRRWHDAAARHRSPAGPDTNLEYLWWQTLVGAWPLDTTRAVRYLEKASREAKEHTSWTEPDGAYDDAVRRFVEGVCADEHLLADVAAFVADLSPAAAAVTLGTKLVQLTMPGVPDVYQRAELVTLRLVDPDNRDPIDPAQLAERLARLGDAVPAPTTDLDGAKLGVTARALHLRRENPGWYAGDYRAISASGPAARHVLAFQRGQAVTVATRLPVGLARSGGWGETVLPLPAGRWTDVLRPGSALDVGTGGGRLAELLASWPVALLVPLDGTR